LFISSELKKGIKMKRSLIPMAIVLSIVSLSLYGPSAYGGGRGGHGGGGGGGGWAGGGHGWSGGGRGGGHYFGSMPARGGQTFTRSGMATWSGQRWGGRNWSGSNWSGQRWGGHNWNDGNWSGHRWSGRNWNHGNWNHHNNNDVIFIGDFGFPLWWGWGWDGGYPYYGYGYGYPYGYGYGNGYGYGGYYDSYYGGTGYENGYPTHSRVAQLQHRLARAGYYSGAIDGIMGPATRQAIRAYERDHGYTS
jgi:putative peptidoglycan binding protein